MGAVEKLLQTQPVVANFNASAILNEIVAQATGKPYHRCFDS